MLSVAMTGKANDDMNCCDEMLVYAMQCTKMQACMNDDVQFQQFVHAAANVQPTKLLMPPHLNSMCGFTYRYFAHRHAYKDTS